MRTSNKTTKIQIILIFIYSIHVFFLKHQSPNGFKNLKLFFLGELAVLYIVSHRRIYNKDKDIEFFYHNGYI